MSEDIEHQEWAEIEHCYARNQQQAVPAHTLEAIENYIKHGIPPGSFLRAVLSNQLKEAFSRADDMNIANMYAIVKYLYNEVPGDSWGSPDEVESWLKSFKRKS